MPIFLRKIDSAVPVPAYTISENAIGIRAQGLEKWIFGSAQLLISI
jgi:hypothetical protein